MYPRQTMMLLFYILATIAILAGILSLREGLQAAHHLQSFRPQTTWTPHVVVFCPCKGADAEFRKNVTSILEQDYPNLRTVFIVESDQDPAFAVLKDLRANVLVAGDAVTRG